MPSEGHQARVIAGLIFGAAGLLLPAVWFGPVLARSQHLSVLMLYVALPGVAAGIAGGVGAPWLQPRRCGSGRTAAVRGALLAAAALALFAPLFALGLRWSESGWTNPLGLTLLILWVSLLTMGWAVLLVGAFAGWLVWRERRRTASAAT